MAELDYEYLADLVTKSQKGNSDAFAEIYAATYKKQYRFTYQYVKDAYLAQDILQEVYILALKNLSKLKNPRLFVSWLNQITFRVCFNTYKKHCQHSSELGDVQDGTLHTHIHPDVLNNPEMQFVRKLDNEEIMEKILSLPATESQAVIMKYYNDMSLEDIASAMNCSKSTVKRHLAHGRSKLEKLLDGQKGGYQVESDK